MQYLQNGKLKGTCAYQADCLNSLLHRRYSGPAAASPQVWSYKHKHHERIANGTQTQQHTTGSTFEKYIRDETATPTPKCLFINTFESHSGPVRRSRHSNLAYGLFFQFVCVFMLHYTWDLLKTIQYRWNLVLQFCPSTAHFWNSTGLIIRI